jgi:hypothetical protein
MFCSVILEKGGDVSSEEILEKSQGGEKYSTNIKIRRPNCNGHNLRKNCLLKGVIEGNIEGRIEVTGR